MESKDHPNASASLTKNEAEHTEAEGASHGEQGRLVEVRQDSLPPSEDASIRTQADLFERQIRSALQRGDKPESQRVQLEFESFLEAARASQELMRAFPQHTRLEEAAPFGERAVAEIRSLLERACTQSVVGTAERSARACGWFVVGEFERAIGEFDLLLGISTQPARLQCNRGLTLLRARQFEQARLAFDAALVFDPDSPAALRGRGLALLERKRPGEALVCLRRALNRVQDPSELHAYCGDALLMLGRPEEALTSYSRALRSRPTHVGVLQRYGYALGILGRHNEADAAYRAAGLEYKPSEYETPTPGEDDAETPVYSAYSFARRRRKRGLAGMLSTTLRGIGRARRRRRSQYDPYAAAAEYWDATPTEGSEEEWDDSEPSPLDKDLGEPLDD